MQLIPKIGPYAGLHNFTHVHSAALSFPLDLLPISFEFEVYEVKFAIKTSGKLSGNLWDFKHSLIACIYSFQPVNVICFQFLVKNIQSTQKV